MKGIVKRFNTFKGFGFIISEDNEDVFFHFSELMMSGYKTVKVGDNVDFNLANTEKGLKAENIIIVKN